MGRTETAKLPADERLSLYRIASPGTLVFMTSKGLGYIGRAVALLLPCHGGGPSSARASGRALFRRPPQHLRRNEPLTPPGLRLLAWTCTSRGGSRCARGRKRNTD